MNRKTLTCLCVLAIGSLTASGDIGISVVDPDGNKTSFAKEKVTRINIAGSQVEVVNDEGESVFFDKDHVKTILLSDSFSGVEKLGGENNELSLRLSKEAIEVSGAEPGLVWSISSQTGVAMMTGRFTAADSMIDIRELPEGIYIFATAGQTLKFIK